MQLFPVKAFNKSWEHNDKIPGETQIWEVLDSRKNQRPVLHSHPRLFDVAGHTIISNSTGFSLLISSVSHHHW